LSSARAAVAVRYFTEVEGMDNKRFFIVGYGDTKPISEEVEKSFMNRRIEITIMKYTGISGSDSVLDKTKEETK
jgi:flagellar motor protein MotB